jgi:Holliday junction DNA helicase RuvA
MFDYINGTLADKSLSDNSTATLDVNGVGYLIYVSQKDFDRLPQINSSIKLFTILIHKEDSMTIYGFLTKDARNIFKILISVSGVGPKMALQLLNAFEPDELSSLVANSDYKSLMKTKGVGQKLAQKIILELKDKFSNFIVVENINSFDVNNQSFEDAKNVLISFGYSQNEINDALSFASKHVSSSSNEEDLLKFSLQFLSQEL